MNIHYSHNLYNVNYLNQLSLIHFNLGKRITALNPNNVSKKEKKTGAKTVEEDIAQLSELKASMTKHDETHES